ncbi:MAG: acyl-CoA/acyl-ACP dehydrogenase [Salinivirgaceae bacterium]|nr:acyl-CoA/acyl-ACP dehydrogenase [Salinivirgaceae bacterium]
MIISNTIAQISFFDFIESFKQTLKEAFYEIDDIEKFIQKRGFPKPVLDKIMAKNPLSVAIPTEYGGRGVKVKECLGILETSAYESLPLALTLGINIALFLESVAKYAQESVKGNIFNRFLTQQNMGGLMITEPDFGSDALNMQTANIRTGSNYQIKGTKHWQGLTGMADYWLMTSRAKNERGEFGRDIDLFICDEHQPNQKIHVEEYYNNIGLYPIPYGKNRIDINVPKEFKLKPETTGLKLVMDLLHRSRMQFPGMGLGFIRRMLDESIKHCSNRIVGGKPLLALDQVKFQISKIQSAFTVSSALCSRSAAASGIENDLSSNAIEANSIKAYISDLMQESSQTLTQLNGANGYKTESVGSRGIVDSRPFQIFEGSNEMLYTQISEMVLKLMNKQKNMNLSSFFKKFELTKNASEYFRSILDFSLDVKMPQRKNVDLGKIISRVISANHVVNLGDKGFRSDLINDCMESIKHEVLTLVSSFKFQTNVSPIEDYKGNSSWLAFS